MRVPHPLPIPTPITDADAHMDTDLDLGLEVLPTEPVAEGDSQSSSSSPDDSSSTDLLTPLFPVRDFPLEDADARPPGTLECQLSCRDHWSHPSCAMAH